MKRLTTILMSAAVSLTALAQPQLTEKNIDKNNCIAPTGCQPILA